MKEWVDKSLNNEWIQLSFVIKKKIASGTVWHQTVKIKANTLRCRKENAASSVYKTTPNSSERDLLHKVHFLLTSLVFREETKRERLPTHNTWRESWNFFLSQLITALRQSCTRFVDETALIFQPSLQLNLKRGKPSVPDQNPSLFNTQAANVPSGRRITT